MKTDWFELKEARLHLAPYTYPHFPIACASTITPSGMIAAGKRRRRAVDRRRPAGRPGGARQAVGHLRGDGAQARPHARPLQWRIVVTPTSPRTTSRRCARSMPASGNETVTYFEDTLGRPPGRADDPLREGVKMGYDAGRHARHGGQGHRAAARLFQRRLRRRAVPRP